MNPSSQSCAFFDIDGTLLEGFITQTFPRYLADNGYIGSTYPDKIDQIVTGYRSGTILYRIVAEQALSLYAQALKGNTLETVQQWAHTYMTAYLPTHILPYTNQLLNQVAPLVDTTIAVSGSHQEVVNELQDLGFDQVYGSVFQVELGRYSGKVEANLILGEVKALRIRQIIEEHNIDLAKSIAFGDTDQDAPMLSMVKIPIALRPNAILKEICQARSWKWFNDEALFDVNNCIDWIKNNMNK